MSQCPSTTTVAGKTFVCVRDNHAAHTNPDRHVYVREDQAS